MKKLIPITTLTYLLLFLSFTANAQKPKDYLSNTVIKLDKVEYKLVWSSHPTEFYYKHEYLSKGEKLESYKTMILIDVLYTDLSIVELVELKARELIERKKTDLVCNYQIMDNPNTGEYMIDFLVSSGTDEHLDIVEWNIHRYKKISDKQGNEGVVLFGMSKRAYKKDIMPFLKGLGDNRDEWTIQIANYGIPLLEIKK